MKKFLLIASFFITFSAFSTTSSKKNSSAKVKKPSSTTNEWSVELKAETSGNLVIKDKQPILHINLEKKDEVTIKVLAKSFAADPAVWKFSVRTRAGKKVKINYDAAAKVWFFKREESKQYSVFVSKRKNNIESIPWLWFEI